MIEPQLGRLLTFVFSKTGHRLFRGVVGVTTLLIGAMAFVRGAEARSPALWLSVLLFGALVLVHVVVDIIWDHLSRTEAGANVGDAPPSRPLPALGPGALAVPGESPTHDRGASDATLQLVTAVISTAGIVLAIIQSFASVATLSLSAKVGTIALATDLVVAFMLFGLVVDKTHPGETAWHFRGYVFSLSLWGLAFGLLCIAMSFVFR
jgi:hypothetical protein